MPHPDSPTRPTICPVDGDARAGHRPHRRTPPLRSIDDVQLVNLEHAHAAAEGIDEDRRAARAGSTVRSDGNELGTGRLGEGHSGDGRRTRAARLRGVAGGPGIATELSPAFRLGVRQRVEQCRACTDAAGWRAPRRSDRTRRFGRRTRRDTRSATIGRTPRSCVTRIRKGRLAPQPVEQPEDSGLHGHVERGRRLVGDQQLGRRRARSRSRPRWRIPPENWCGNASGAPLRIRDPHLAEQLRARRGQRLRAPLEVMPHVLGELTFRPTASDAARSSGPGRPSRPRCRGPSRKPRPRELEQYLPAVDRPPSRDAPARQQLQQRERRHRLAAAALAGDAEDLARLDPVVHPVDDREGRPSPGAAPVSPSTSSRRHSPSPPSRGTAGRRCRAGCRRRS